MRAQTATRLGFWSSAVILASGLALLSCVVASGVFLPTALTTEWIGVGPYVDAYRATGGGTITALSFLAALVSCPAYLAQVASIHASSTVEKGNAERLGILLSGLFVLFSGLCYVVQLTVVRKGILSGDVDGLEALIFQNPRSPLLALDFVEWFLLASHT